MSIFTISPDFFQNVDKEEGVYFSDVLFVFTQRGNPYKVTKDKNGDVITIYSRIKENGDIIKTWLDLMTYKPSTFEKIDVDLSSIDCMETKFLTLCRATKGDNNLIVYSKQNIKNFECKDGKIDFDNIIISILDKDDAHIQLGKVEKMINNTYVNSQVAQAGSQIIASTNNK